MGGTCTLAAVATTTSLDAIEWASECVRRGAGELLVTSIDRDGVRTGYDLELTAAIADRVAVPVIASGGAGSASDVCDAIIARTRRCRSRRWDSSRRRNDRSAHQGRNGAARHSGARHMTSARNETLLQAVSDVARLTGQTALAHYRTRLDVETKADGSPVTIADRAAEEAARAWISAHFPNESILGEEFGADGDQTSTPLVDRSNRRNEDIRPGRSALGNADWRGRKAMKSRRRRLLSGRRRDGGRGVRRGLLVERLPHVVSPSSPTWLARRCSRPTPASSAIPTGLRDGRQSQTKRLSFERGAIAMATCSSQQAVPS